LGREHEREALLAALERAPVALVCGNGGLGKTALVCSALHERRPPCLDRTLAFSASPTDRTGEQLVQAILTELSDLLGGGRPAGGAPGDIVASCVDLADTLDAVIVLDDLHFVSGPLVRDLLSAASTYARKSRWVGTSRAELDLPGAEGQTIALGPLKEDVLSTLARAWNHGMSADEAEHAAREANGSPFWLKQRLTRGKGAQSDARSMLLAELSAETKAWVLTLAWLETPLPDSVLDVFGRCPPAAELAALELRGLLERVPEGTRLHAVARSTLAVEGDNEPIAEALSRSEEPGLLVESVRLDVAAGRLERAITTASSAAPAIVAAGLAPHLWQVLDAVDEPRLLHVKLACALDLGGGAALDWALEQPAPALPGTRRLWLEALLIGPRAREAAERARILATEVEASDPALAASALLLAARAFVWMAEPAGAEEAARRARELVPEDVEVAARGDAWIARACVFAGRGAEALELCSALEPKLAGLSLAARREIEEQRGAVYMNLGRTRRAHDTFVRARRDGLVSAEQLGVRTRLVRGSLFALELGRMQEARRLLDELAPVARRSYSLFPFHSMNEIRYWTALGDLEQSAVHLAALRQSVTKSEMGYWSSWLASPVHYLGVLGAQPLDESTAASGTDFPLTRALGAWHEVRAVGSSTRLDALPKPDVLDAVIVTHLADAARRCITGDGTRAAEAARAAIALAEDDGLVLWQADAQLALAEALFVAGNAGLEKAVASFVRFCEPLGPTRYAEDAAFFRELARGSNADLAVLDRLAGSPGACHAARRSRAILDIEAPLDRLDALVVERARAVVARPTRIAPGVAARPGLGLDTRRTRVSLPTGTSVDLSRKPVAMKILVALFDGGGRASKEKLVHDVWQVADYHPLRDDKRLQVAISRLRALLGDESLVQTTEEGYRLSPDVPAYRV
jgi:tetratricopeptide (TPR) repeat protein